MKPLLRMIPRGGAALVLAAFTSSLAAHMEPTPRLTPPPTFIDANASTLSSADRGFLGSAASANRRGIAVSQAVMDQLSNPQIKSFAQQVISEDTLSGSDLSTLAEQKGVDLPAREESALADEWSKKTVEVDRLYMGEMVSGLEATVKLYEEASASSDPDVASYAQKTLPGLERQLNTAQDLQKAAE